MGPTTWERLAKRAFCASRLHVALSGTTVQSFVDRLGLLAWWSVGSDRTCEVACDLFTASATGNLQRRALCWLPRARGSSTGSSTPLLSWNPTSSPRPLPGIMQLISTSASAAVLHPFSLCLASSTKGRSRPATLCLILPSSQTSQAPLRQSASYLVSS